jgi:hypothetical protein
MLSFLAKAAFAGLVTALVATIARRYPAWGGLVAALPLTSILALSLLWADTGDAAKVSQLSYSIVAFVLPSVPMFFLLPGLLKGGLAFWPALALSVVATLALYALTFALLPRLGFRI